MFGWLKRSKTAGEPKPAPTPAPDNPASLERPRTSKANGAGAVAPSPSIALQTPASERRLRGPRRPIVPTGYKEPAPTPGMVAMELTPMRFRRAVVTRTFAGGRRIIARVGPTNHPYCYSKRDDGTYRLESFAGAGAPRLVLGLDAASMARKGV